MSISVWLTVGLLAGLVTTKLIVRSREGLLRDMILGSLGAVAGGWVFSAVSTSDPAALLGPAILFTLVGAGVALYAYHVVFLRVR